MDLVDKDYKLDIINTCKEETIAKELQASMRTMSCQNKNINTERYIIFKMWMKKGFYRK